MRKTFHHLYAAILLPLALASCQKPSQHRIWFDEPCKTERPSGFERDAEDTPDYNGGVTETPEMSFNQQWEYRSLPIGCGDLGANVMGSIATERLTLNEKSLWTGGPGSKEGPQAYWGANQEGYKYLDAIREALKGNRIEEADQIMMDHFNSASGYAQNGNYADLFGTYTTLGELLINTGIPEEGISNYERSLDIDRAVATVSFKSGKDTYKRTFLASHPARVIAARFESSKKQDLSISYAHSGLISGTTEKDSENGLLFRGHLKGNNEALAVRILVKATDGQTEVKDGSILVSGARNVVVYLTADTDYKMNFDPQEDDAKAYVGTDPVATTLGWISGAPLWKALLEEHEKDYRSLYDRVQFNLSGPVSDLPTDERLEAYRNGGTDRGLEELYFQFGRYLLISCSRPGDLPANLQGVWLQSTTAPWASDYHNNINIQMNYWPALQDNLEECVEPLHDFIRSLVKPGRKTARSYWNARGWAASISANIYGFTAPQPGKSVQWNYNPAAASWLATHLWDYYDFTHNEAFLRDTAYPIIKECAEFCQDYLWRNESGMLSANPSTSPEHGSADEGATFVHGVLREILMDAIEASRVLDVDQKEAAEWETMLRDMVPYQIGRYGQLMEWSRDIDDPDDHHRHVNHLFGLHPGRTISPISTPDLAEAAKVVLNHRGDESTGWSMGWKLNQWARLHDGERAYTLYRTLLEKGTADNLWDIHPPFQIDGNFGGTAGVTEMFLQSHDGMIHLLPALPYEWEQGSVLGIRARGNFTVDIYWKDASLVKAVIKSGSGLPLKVRYKGKTTEIQTSEGQTYELTGDDLK